MNYFNLATLAMRQKKKLEGVLDSATSGCAPILDGASEDVDRMIKAKAAAAVQEWTETNDLDEGESYSDRLFALLVGIADANQDGELDDDEQAVLMAAINCAWDYLIKYGVEEDDANALLNEWDVDAGDRIRDLIAASLPGDNAASEDIDNFAYGESDQEPLFDSAVMDAVYKKTMVIRKGKKVRINKRVSGRVRLTAKQKVAIRKAGMRSHSAAAMVRRAKSMRLRKRTGLSK